jgi:hypothetical protein
MKRLFGIFGANSMRQVNYLVCESGWIRLVLT